MSQREKRKLHDDHGHHNLVVSSTTQKKVRDAHVTDDEVEEFYTREICILVPGKGNYYWKAPTQSKIIIKSLGPFLQLFAYVQ